MRTWIGVVVIVLLSTRTAAAAAGAATPEQQLAGLAWMSGTWSATVGGAEVEEHWLAPRGGVMVGVNRTVGERRTSFEFLRIEATATGVAYLASPGGAPPTSFPLVETGAERAVFANPEHDFPQRILYWKEGADTLCARVEGDVGGRVEGEQWCWQRVP